MTTLILMCISLTLNVNQVTVTKSTAAMIRNDEGHTVALKECRKAYPDTELAYLVR